MTSCICHNQSLISFLFIFFSSFLYSFPFEFLSIFFHILLHKYHLIKFTCWSKINSEDKMTKMPFIEFMTSQLPLPISIKISCISLIFYCHLNLYKSFNYVPNIYFIGFSTSLELTTVFTIASH